MVQTSRQPAGTFLRIRQPVGELQSAALAFRNCCRRIAEHPQKTSRHGVARQVELTRQPDRLVMGFLAVRRNHLRIRPTHSDVGNLRCHCVDNCIDAILDSVSVHVKCPDPVACVHAVNKIKRINALDPGNQDARTALYKVVGRYIYLARKVKGRRGKEYLESAYRAAPDLLEIDQAWDELYAPELPAWYADPHD